MTVQYYDITRLTEDQADELGVRFALFEEVLRTSDIVSLHVPLTKATRHMMGAAQLRLMKPTAYLVNTCRGPVVDEAALIEALATGTIAGAGLDVFDKEPPPPDNPLFALQNVVLTAHLAGPTRDNQYTRFRNAFDNCQRVVRGEKPLWVIPELRTGSGWPLRGRKDAEVVSRASPATPSRRQPPDKSQDENAGRPAAVRDTPRTASC